MDKKKTHVLARFRGWIQGCASLLTNIQLPNFKKGVLYQGAGKYVCVPGLNCYSCPGAAGACPIGAFQAVVGSSKFKFSYYITGILILIGVLLAVVLTSVFVYRPFCKWLCPLGAFYALLNKVSLFQMRVDTGKCVSCGACARACKMDVDITKSPNHTECIRCGMCMKACPTDAIRYTFVFGDLSQNENKEKEQNQ